MTDWVLLLEKSAVIANLTVERLWELIKSPIQFPDMIWIIIPLLLTMLLMEFYFGRYRKEELGWNTAFGNSLVLIFVSLDLIRHLYYQGSLFVFDIRSVIVGIVILEGLMLTILDFYHILPKNFAYGLSSKSPINFLALIAIILVYSNIVIDLYTALAIFLAIFGLYGLIALVYFIAYRENVSSS